jgi:hypothetical protein
MLESLIKNDNEKAAESLHEYITLKTREIMLGEQFDDEDEDMGDDDMDDEDMGDDEGDMCDDDMGDDDMGDDDMDDEDMGDDMDDEDMDDDEGDMGDEDMGDDMDDEGITEGKFTEKPPALGKQPMTGMSGGSKMSKYKLSKDSISSDIKGDSLKNQGRKETKAFKEKPKSAPDYKDGVDHKAGARKNRSKVR